MKKLTRAKPVGLLMLVLLLIVEMVLAINGYNGQRFVNTYTLTNDVAQIFDHALGTLTELECLQKCRGIKTSLDYTSAWN